MKVLALAADSGACAFYRLKLPARHVESDVTVDDDLTVGRLNGRTVHVPTDADVVVFQRPSAPHLVEMIPVLQAQGVGVVVELDDDFTCLHPSNPARSLVASQCLALACRIADLVTVTTPALARRYAPHGRVAVLPNCVPSDYLTRDPVRAGAGWSGSVDTHPDDLQVTRGGVARAVDDLHVIGTGKGVKDALGLSREPTVTGWVPLEEYPDALAKLKVGIVPLADTGFNRAKSGLKMLEMASLGVAPVVSPTPDNLRLNALGVGVVAYRPRDWTRHVEALLADPTEVQERSRAAAGTQTIEEHAWKWDEAWASAVARSKARGPLRSAPSARLCSA